MNNHTLLELHVPNFDKVKQFYGNLGFEVAWERRPEAEKGYLVIQKDDNILCFWGGSEVIENHPYFKQFDTSMHRGYGVEIVIQVDDLDTAYELAKKSTKIVEDIRVRPWGLRDFRLEDPFGFYLRFTTKHNILDPGNAVK